MITLAQATADRNLSDEAARMMVNYYEADTLAEHVLAELLAAHQIPGRVLGVDIFAEEMESTEGNVYTFVSYACPVNEIKELAVELAFDDAGHEILLWSLRDTTEWVPENEIQFFEGF
ncbi:MAG: hypothetical protein FWE91_09040 [Defluviitaleaceae bacterium]|nr:hypothetical protein [Defluviitaleaceae bacterium]MCL2837197.1 hypothetical protein [Defluviitaleaceae bacterium]